MKKKCILKRLILLVMFGAFASSMFAQGVGYVDKPYFRYEAQDGTRGGGAKLYDAFPNYDFKKIAAMASDRKYVGLPSGSGNTLEWTIRQGQGGDGLTVRFTAPDRSDGWQGMTGTRPEYAGGQHAIMNREDVFEDFLEVYVNGVKRKVEFYGKEYDAIPLSSYWSWQYFNDGADQPMNKPGGGYARFAFDEQHVIIKGAKLQAGDKLQLRNVGGRGEEIGVDFIEIESVPSAIQAPANSLSVVDYGAKPNDRTSNDSQAIDDCLKACISQGKVMYFPPGVYNYHGSWAIGAPNGVTITGAGMWHTDLHFPSAATRGGGVCGDEWNKQNSKWINMGHMYISCMLTDRYDQQAIYKGFMEPYGDGSRLHNLWVEHFECGFWIGDYDETQDQLQKTTNLTIDHCRIRNNLADGVNFCVGTSDSKVTYCSVRGNGDDGLAMWNDSSGNFPDEYRNEFSFNDVENNWRAGGIAIFGGEGHVVKNNYIVDCYKGSGIRLSTTFPGHKFSNTTNITIKDNIILRSGCSVDCYGSYRGAIDVDSGVKNVTFENNQICDAGRNAIQLSSGGSDNIKFINTTVNRIGWDGGTNAGYTFTGDIGLGRVVFAKGMQATFDGLEVRNCNLQDTPAADNYSMFNISNGTTNLNFVKQPVIIASYGDADCVCSQVDVTSISMLPATATISTGGTVQLNVTFTPSDATNKTVAYDVISGTGVVSVDANGLVTGVAPGTATIRATSNSGGKTATSTITVQAVSLTGVSLSNLSIGIGGSGTLTPSFTPANASNKNVTYDIVTGNDVISLNTTTGLVGGLKAGTATVRVTTAEGGHTATATVTVNPEPDCDCPVFAKLPAGTAAPVMTGTTSVDPMWNGLDAMPIDKRVLNNGGTMTGYAASWKAIYDDTNLYLLVDIQKPSAHSEFYNFGAGTGNYWQGSDVVEVYIDGNNSKSATYGSGDGQLIFFESNNPQAGSGAPNMTGVKSTYANLGKTGHRTAQITIPLSNFGISSATGTQVGFDIGVNISKGNASDGRVAQYTTFNSSDNNWASTANFGTVSLKNCPNYFGGGSETYPVESISTQAITLPYQGSETVPYTLNPSFATIKSVSYSLQSGSQYLNLNTATGEVTWKSGPGTAVVRVTADDTTNGTKYADCTITVQGVPAPIGVTSVVTSSLGVQTNRTAQIAYTVLPANAANKAVTYSIISGSSNITLDTTTGIVTGKAVGTAVVRITSADNTSAYADCTITISDVVIPPTPTTTRGYYDAPYVRYEADFGTLAGGATSSQKFDQAEIESEASYQTAVIMPRNASVEWSVTAAGRGLVIRYAMPRGSADQKMGVYSGSTRVGELNLSTHWSWENLMEDSNPNYNGVVNPNWSNRFDDARVLLANDIAAGGKLRLVNEGNANVYLDFAELEPVAAPLTLNDIQTSKAKIAYDGNGSVQDFVNGNAGKVIFFPAGTYNIPASLELYYQHENTELHGAGMWHTTLNFTSTSGAGGIWAWGNGNHMRNLSLRTNHNSRTNAYKGINGSWGKNSEIENVWVEHFECGAWIANYGNGNGNANADGLHVFNCRFRNNYADGINLCRGSVNCVVEHCSFRNNGDDDMAVWSADGMECKNNLFQFNTAEFCWFASSCAVYGGESNKFHNIIVRDNRNAGLRVNNTFPGVGFSNSGMHEFKEITVERCGTYADGYNGICGAIDFFVASTAGNSVNNVTFSCIDVIDSKVTAIWIQSKSAGASFNNIHWNNINIDGTNYEPLTVNDPATSYTPQGKKKEWGGGHGIVIADKPNGTMSFCNVQFFNIGGGEERAEEMSLTGAGDLNISYPDDCAACESYEPQPVDGITITPTTQDVVIGGTGKVTATVSPRDAENKNVTYSLVSGAGIINLNTSTGSFTTLAEGTAVIKATAVGNPAFTAQAIVNVVPVPPLPPCDGNVIAKIPTSMSAPSIDGQEDAIWTNVKANLIANRILDANGGGNMAGFEASWKAVYDNSNLYLLVDVQKPSAHSELYTNTGASWWQGTDAVCVYFDASNNKGDFAAADDTQAVFIYNSTPTVGTGNASASGMNCSWANLGNGKYRAEILIPLSNVFITPQDGKEIGFDVVIDVAKNQGEGGRVAQYASYTSLQTQVPNNDPYNLHLHTQGYGDVEMRECENYFDSTPSDPIAVTSVTTQNVSLVYQGSANVPYTINPSNATNKKVSFELVSGSQYINLNTSTGAISWVSGPGTAVVRVIADDTTNGTKSANCTITVAEETATPPCDCPVFAKLPADKSAPVMTGTTSIDFLWDDVKAMPIDKRVLNEGGNMAGYAASWKAIYDDTNLYLLVDVQKPSAHSDFYNFGAGTANYWQGSDVIEVYIDGNNSKGGYGAGDGQLIFFANNNPQAGSGTPNMTGVKSTYANLGKTGHRTAQITIPLSNFGISSAADTQVGFDIGVNISQSNTANGRVAQYTTFNNGDNNWSTTANFGTVSMKECSNYFPQPTDIEDVDAEKDAVAIVKEGDYIKVTSSVDNLIYQVEVYDFQGRRVQSAYNLNSTEAILPVVASKGSVIIVRVQTESGIKAARFLMK